MTAHQLIWLPVAFASNMTVIYALTFIYYPEMYVIFPRIEIFILVFGVSYVLFAVTYGWWYVKRSGIWKGGVEVWARENPFFIDMMKNQVKIMKDQQQILKRIDNIEKTWIKSHKKSE